MYQNGTLPRLVWPLHFCEVVTTTVERKESEWDLRRWVTAPPSFTSTGLYSNSTQCRISVSTVVEEFIVAKCRLVITFKDPADGRIARAEIKQEQEESGQQTHQWTKQRVCCTYEESLESQALGTKARECHIFSSTCSKKHQQHAQREALWFRLK